MSNVPLGSGGTSPHAARFKAEVDYQRLIHSLAIRAELAAAMYLTVCKTPLSLQHLASLAEAQTELFKTDEVCAQLFGMIVSSLSGNKEPAKPATDDKDTLTLFVIPPTGPYSEGL